MKAVLRPAPAAMLVGTVVACVLAVLLPSDGGGAHGQMPSRVTPATRSLPLGGCVPAAHGNHRLRVDAAHPAVTFHVPPGTTDAKRPLVLVLPGFDETGGDIAQYTGYSRLADREGFVVAYPTATGAKPSWNIADQPGRPDDVAYLRAVIGALEGAPGCVDPQRVTVTGVSNGGGMTVRLACDAADLLAAAAPVAGGYSSLPACAPKRPLPILEIHGLKDEVVPYSGKGADHAGSVDTFLRQWRGRDSCPAKARRSKPADDVLELRWSCAHGLLVVHDRVTDAMHGWPGESSLKPFSSTARTWAFLSAFRND